eukprot:TRINITY_DN529_c0_g1_i1.p1 TRINITY_DN529_c0_g1~~TRINITY_DN529_c0_g1_i1.p1  ORF type:complete len:202 (+),score=18.67 TRINITY_DN529_c0_g1_i1:64-606(+)
MKALSISCFFLLLVSVLCTDPPLKMKDMEGYWRSTSIGNCVCSSYKNGACQSWKCSFAECGYYWPTANETLVYMVDGLRWMDHYDFESWTGWTDGDRGPQLMRFRNDYTASNKYQLFAINVNNSYLQPNYPPENFSSSPAPNAGYKIYRYVKIASLRECSSASTLLLSSMLLVILILLAL